MSTGPNFIRRGSIWFFQDRTMAWSWDFGMACSWDLFLKPLESALKITAVGLKEKRDTFLKKLWCCVDGEYNKIIWFYQLGW